jgi:hypothetical protein
MPIELTPVQMQLAQTLSAHAKDACTLVGLKCQKCEPHHFYLTINRYYGKVQGMTTEIDRCIEWCMSKGKLVFTAQRFGKWCANTVRWKKEETLRKSEMSYTHRTGHSSVG